MPKVLKVPKVRGLEDDKRNRLIGILITSQQMGKSAIGKRMKIEG